jgi:CBS domain-containing protein
MGTRSGEVRTVADAMDAPPVIVEPAMTVQDTSAAMLDARAHAAVVVDGGRVRGLVTVEDISRALARGYDAAETLIGTVVEDEPPLARPDEALAEVHQRMRAAGHGVVAVVGSRREPIGVLADSEAAG